jgi:hypothetical protein
VRSWQRVGIVGGTLLVAGAIALIAKPSHDHSFQQSLLTLVSVIFVGVGGSVLASGLVARMVSRQVFGIDIGDAVEALRGASALTRSNQTLELTVELAGNGVRVTAEHRFDLISARPYRQRLPFRLYTDVARWGANGGGFSSVVEPDGSVLQEESLRKQVRTTEGKAEFEKEYDFYPRRPARFVIATYGLFRASDRLIWTVEHLSSDFDVRIRDLRGSPSDVHVKINHHRSGDISKAMGPVRPTGQGRLTEFAYLGEVLPYQGFELQWGDDTGVA